MMLKSTLLLLVAVFLASRTSAAAQAQGNQRKLEDAQPTITLTLLDASYGNPIIQSLLHYTNTERRNFYLKDLRHNAKLAGAAQTHATDMAENSFFSHTGSDGSTLGVRLQRTNYQYSRAGENLYYRYPDESPAKAVQGWMDSPGHRGNLLNPAFVEVGFGYATDSWGRHFYVQVLGTSLTDPSDFLLTTLLELDDTGSVIDLAFVPSDLSIEATVDGDDYNMLPIESVHFNYDNTHDYSDEVSPYSLAGESIDGVTHPMEIKVGTHSLTTTVLFWNGDTVSRTIEFSVVNSSALSPNPTVFPSLAPSMAPSPVPSTAVPSLAPTEEKESTFKTFYLVNAGVDDDGLFKANKNKTYALHNIEILDAGPYDPEYFKTYRWAGRMKYTFSSLAPKTWHNITIGWAEIYPKHCAAGPGARVMDVVVNRQPFLTDFDVLEHVPCHTAHFEHGVFRANSNGVIKIKFSRSVHRPFVSLIHVQTPNELLL